MEFVAKTKLQMLDYILQFLSFKTAYIEVKVDVP